MLWLFGLLTVSFLAGAWWLRRLDRRGRGEQSREGLASRADRAGED